MEVGRVVIDRIEARLAAVCLAYAPNLKFLATVRMLFGAWVVIFPVNLTWMAHVPQDFFHPRPGLFFFITEPPTEIQLLAFSICTAILGCLVALGLFTMPASVGLSLILVIGSGFSYSFSKVDHFILFELAPIFFAFAGWGRVWSLDFHWSRRVKREAASASGMPVLLFAIVVGWGMLSAALPKVRGGWLEPDRFATRGYLARDIALDEKLGPLGPIALQIDSDIFWKFVDYATLIAEGGLILFVFFPFMYRLWLLLIVGFHIGVYLGLGISFADYILVYGVFFSPAVVGIARRVSNSRLLHRFRPRWLSGPAAAGHTGHL